jgi:phage terminase large subunit GpA-like protein
MASFADPELAYQRASAVVMPRKRMKVSEAAEKYRFIASGGQVGMWRNATAPYMTEPMDCSQSREYDAVVFVGPARCAKTASLIGNKLLHSVICDPSQTLLLHTTQSSARLFSQEQLDPMIRLCPEMAARLSPARNDDNIYDKRFAGMRLVIGWPTVDHLSAKDYQTVLITEYDRMPDDVGGEGSVFELARKRPQTFGTLGMVVVECSPGRPLIEDPERLNAPRGPHEAPPTTGILELYNQGDRRLLYWPCPHCNGFFEGRSALFDWPKRPDGKPDGEIEEVCQQVRMICPHCGDHIEERHKQPMNRDGRWLREGLTIASDNRLGGAARKASIASFWLKGPAASFMSWPALLRNYLKARESFERTGDSAKLRTVTNVDDGEVFFPPKSPDEILLDPEAIKTRAESDWRLGTVPAGARAIVVTVDVQGRYFDVQVTGFGAEFECWILDRFQISQSMEDGRLIDPGAYPEDWALLLPLLERGWPLAADPAREMRPLTMLIDSGGAPGVTGNAYKFAVAARRAGIDTRRLILLRGDSKVGDRRIALTKVDWTERGKVIAKGLSLLRIGSNEMKDDVAAALRRETPGPGYVHTPLDLNDEWYRQVTAERRTDKGWEKSGTGVRNEALDHMVYARAGLLRPPWRWDRIAWTGSPPAYALAHDTNPLIRARSDASAAAGAPGAPGAPGVVNAAPAAAPADQRPARKPWRRLRRSAWNA